MLPAFQDEAGALLVPALEHGMGLFQIEDIWEMCREGRNQLWVAQGGGRLKAAVITSIQQYPRKRALEIHFCGGNSVDEWLAGMMELLEQFGRAQGCDLIFIGGRRGWKRKLPDYHESNVMMSKELL